MKAVLLRGERGQGKTKACLALLAQALARGLSAGGVICPAMLDAAGEKSGCRAMDARTGLDCELGSRERQLGGPTWKKWSFSAEGFAFANRAVGDSIARGDRILFLDEIGPVELELGKGLYPSLVGVESALAKGECKSTIAILAVRPELAADLASRLGKPLVLSPGELTLERVLGGQ